MKLNKKGEGYVGAMVTAFLALFMIIILWNVFTPVINTVYQTIEPKLEEQNQSDALDITEKMYTSWKYYPIILVIAIIVFMIVRGIAREQYEY